jgi:hypothetical protein
MLKMMNVENDVEIIIIIKYSNNVIKYSNNVNIL